MVGKTRFKKIEVTNGDSHTYRHDPEVCQRLGVSVRQKGQENGWLQKRHQRADQESGCLKKEKIDEEEITS